MTTRVSRFQRRSPRQARSRATVAAIVEAAAQILERGGPDSLTTSVVAERAGVSIGTLYQYFPDKQALLVAAARRELSEEPSRRNALLAALIDWIERFGARPAAADRSRRVYRLDRRARGGGPLERLIDALAPPELAPIRVARRPD